MSNPITIVSFNIRCTWKKTDGVNSFLKRAGLIWEKITTERPEIIAFQEVTPNICRFLKAALSAEYDLYGQFRGADYESPEGVFTALRRDAFQLVGMDTFWLSPTPRVPGSRFEGQSQHTRDCTVLTVRHPASGKLLQVWNTHLDCAGQIEQPLRRDQMQVILDHMAAERAKRPFPGVLLGDLNATPEEPALALAAANGLSDVTPNNTVTSHGFGRFQMKIDYLLATADLAAACTSHGIWDDCSDGVYLSDHYPVWAVFDLDSLTETSNG